ncbi:MAG: ABC transporter substrate-binding protein [Bacteroides sp]|nr:ABC transporter substrate-binding protein [Bacteroides sp.]
MKTICKLLCLVTLLTGCSNDDTPKTVDNRLWQEHTIAVVLPMDNGLDVHWKRTLEWVVTNMERAFSNQDEGIRLNYEWYDENTSDIKKLAKELAEREDIEAVIGGLYSVNTEIMAPLFIKKDKPFFTLATTAELVRAYSGGSLWAMTETDITQCEVLLSKAVYYGAKSVALLANGEDVYGKTFIDWFAFQAKELGLEIKGTFTYTTTTLSENSRQAAASEADYVLCIPSEIEDIRPMLEAFNQHALQHGKAPRTLFSDTAYGSDVINKTGNICEGLEGVTFGADPESGFDVSYKVYFDEAPTLAEAQVYDAAMLLGYGLWYQHLNMDVDLNEAIRQVVDGKERHLGSWMEEDMRLVVDALAQGRLLDVKGASGNLDFDSKVYTNVLNTTYYNFKIYNGQYIILDYNSSDGNKRTDATLAGWNWKKEHMQEFNEQAVNFDYPDLNDKWALLVAGSSGWKNYRHQADVLAMYQLLKARGYKDERIVLVMEDDIAFHSSNPQQGIIQVSVGGENLYQQVEVDYRLSDLNPEDIKAILLGQENEKLHQVIRATNKDNVLVFWSGHGLNKELCWDNHDTGLTYDLAKEIFEEMNEEKVYRKSLWLVETCYSGSVMQACEGFPGILAITAANANETSKADIFSSNLGVWMSNRFTYTLRDEITNDASISLRELYYKLFINTVGSHVMLYNEDCYGNIFTNTIEEFL